MGGVGLGGSGRARVKRKKGSAKGMVRLSADKRSRREERGVCT